MHMQGQPANMQHNPSYESIISDLLFFFSKKINILNSHGINDIIIDPGFGFGKTNQDNFKLLKNLAQLKLLDLPILAGISRKSMVYKTLKTNTIRSINGTTALHMEALKNGAKILRVHDIIEAQECIKLHKNLII